MAKRSLYEYIESSLVNGELPSDFSLPHENDDDVFWADGARDGVMIYHMHPSELSEEDQILMEKTVKAVSAHEFDTADELFYQLKDHVRALSLIDPMQNYIYDNKQDMNPGNILFYAAHLIMESDSSELVKYGLSMLELISTEGDENLQNVIRTLGLSDEFTLFSVFVMRNWLCGNEDIFELAKKVHGWGRIHTVARLRPDTEEIRHWLLTEGVHNNVMPAYSAPECWQKSNAEEKLFSQLTYEEYQGIRDIIVGLLDEGPVSGISMLKDADRILARFLKQSEFLAASASDYIAVNLIRKYLEDEKKDDELFAQCDRILSSQACQDAVQSALRQGYAADLAKDIGIAYQEDIFRLMQNDFQQYYYFADELFNDDEYHDQITDLFRKSLPLNELKTAPALSLGLGEEFKKYTPLEKICYLLSKYPLEGKEFIETGLQASPIRTRNAALYALEEWIMSTGKPLSELLPDIHELLEKLVEIEPDDQTKEKMQKLMSGETSFNHIS